MSKALTVVPASVRTFSDLGLFAFGELGRHIVLVSEAGVCFLSPIAFLILGGTTLLPFLFGDGEDDRDTTEWIILMAVGVLPVILIPTLKATGPLCYIGGLAAVVTDSICLFYSLAYLDYSPRETQIRPDSSIQTFGTIMFAMGTAIIIPPIQRQHTEPSRLANLVSLTLLLITSVYLIIGVTTYYQYGCTAPATLLAELPAGAAKTIASACMLIHVVIAFPVLLQPTLFDIERFLLGKDADIEVLEQRMALAAAKLAAAESPTGKPILGLHHRPIALDDRDQRAATVPSLEDERFLYGSSSSSSATPYVRSPSPTVATPRQQDGESSTEESAYLDTRFTMGDRLCSALVRTVTVALQTVLAVLLQTSFTDVLSFIGATAVTVSCMIMPCLCYLKVYPINTETFVGKCDKWLCYAIIIVSFILGTYCTVVAAGNIIRDMERAHILRRADATLASTTSGDLGDGEAGDTYPYCHEGERN